MNDLSSATARARLVVNVEMDDRTVLFPDGKFLTHVAIAEDAGGGIRLDAVFLFNESRTEATIASIEAEDARELGRALLEAVFQGRTQHVLSETARIAVVFNPNGFVLRFGEERALRELFIASPAIVRLAQGVLRMVDRVCALPPH
ncbi:hypothetical protein HL658_34645 [Azospirillum sp. RWY-5-1]|uniref:Roadblock/LC7 domain-containing protein n=1 Tax=Azospirillum oleiclasticum TaxID=2735135 RepID=A0ABX2TKT0_9PROT|nr:hypothetical protein [Azospirillum oleiclasticum]NYZ17712.1 hypothetical protein [Azospirillum oleiclasticum]NYZ24959.1 hypothetical protein [Azospirillum oleiclasticum]